MKKHSVRFMILIISLLLYGCSDRTADVQTDQYLVGAHYYSWYPNNWGSGCLIRLLDPEQRPWLGYYASWDLDVVEQHIAWCSQYGIDFLTIDWWPERANQGEHFQNVFLKARNIDDIKFCIFYETWSLNFDPGIGATTFNEDVIDKFVESISGIAVNFFSHPSYLKIDDRPVIVLYLTRTFAGSYEKALKKARKEVRARGYDLFIIGDEVFWNVSPVVKKGELPHPLVADPQKSRIKCFDAITSYNMYESAFTNHAGYPSESSHIGDVQDIYGRYIAAAGDDVYFVPQIMPGYNDRGGRLLSDHHVIPRRWSADAEEGSFFAKSFEKLAFKFVDPRLNMILITSWNEWVENTAIEPLSPAPATTQDKGSGGTNYTCGYKFSGYGTKYLEIVRDKVAVIHGRITDEKGEGLKGQTVRVKQGAVTAEAVTDSRGYYLISRLNFQPGECVVMTEHHEPRSTNIQPQEAVEVSFIFSGVSE